MTTAILGPIIGDMVLVTQGEQDYEGRVQAVIGDMVLVRFDGRLWPVIGRDGERQFAAWLWLDTSAVTVLR